LAESFDFRMNDRVECLEFCAIAEDHSSQSRTIKSPVSLKNAGSPALDDSLKAVCSRFDRAPREDVGVDQPRAVLEKELRDGTLTTGNVTG